MENSSKMEEMEMANASSTLALVHPPCTNKDLPTLCDGSEICAHILLDMKYSESHSKMKRKSKKKTFKSTISYHTIQIFECRMCHQKFTFITLYYIEKDQYIRRF